MLYNHNFIYYNTLRIKKGGIITAACTFFGHSDCPDNIIEEITKIIINLYKSYNVTEYYVGNHGNFDSLVYTALNKMQQSEPSVKIYRVYAYFPKENSPHSIYPEGLEAVPKKFCIDKRNRWMINKSDYVVTYIRKNFGGAVKYAGIAAKQNKTMINI